MYRECLQKHPTHFETFLPIDRFLTSFSLPFLCKNEEFRFSFSAVPSMYLMH
uniref:Uncharacterized protein n=1 Tax=Rhizophora mucronata TaxID=61149 RepID=A0A2P2PSZ4_RHIMU